MDQAPQDQEAIEVPPEAPRLPLGRLFARFLRFGLCAWGGPAAQIAMIQHELVDHERWITAARFRRVLGVYQLLPGPEAHELCCYFGYLSRGRIGALVAGAGFMLPGLVLMLVLSWAYVRHGGTSPLVLAAFAGVQPAVAALVVRAVHRIGGRALARDPWLWAVACASLGASIVGVHFGVVLIVGGMCFVAAGRRRCLAMGCLLAIVVVAIWARAASIPPNPAAASATVPALPIRPVPGELLVSGLKAGLLTFGGAYTVIPFLREDAVTRRHWVTESEFIDGIGLAGVLPAPLVIFGTFVGFVSAGWVGALAITLGIFAPAFSFTMLGHGVFERVLKYAPVHRFLDGVTASVVGMIAATALHLVMVGVTSVTSGVIFLAGLAVLFAAKGRWTVPAVVLGAGVVGAALVPIA